MSDCSTEAMKSKLSRGHYLDGYRDGHGDCVRSFEPAYNDLKNRYKQLEKMIRRMHRYIKKDADYSLSPAKDTAAKYYREEIEALGVSLDD